MTTPAKERIRRAFEGAAHSYDGAAKVQRRICGRLALALPPTITPGVIVDAGCGTGYALRLLRQRFPPANLIGLDLAPAMLRKTPRDAHRLAGDVECLPLADAVAGLYWSSLTLQWCRLPAALIEARRVLWDGGMLAMATLGPDTFVELREAFATGDSYRHTLDFLAPEAVVAVAEGAGFTNIQLRRERQFAHYASLKSLLRAIKAIGANQIGGNRRTGLMSRAAWQRIEAAYEARRQPCGLPLTYDVLYLTARR